MKRESSPSKSCHHPNNMLKAAFWTSTKREGSTSFTSSTSSMKSFKRKPAKEQTEDHHHQQKPQNARELKQGQENPYNNITPETKLLREIKDIVDELNMLKSLAENQERVWKQMWESGKNPYATFTYSSPSDIKN